jgi:hypothetical protein
MKEWEEMLYIWQSECIALAYTLAHRSCRIPLLSAVFIGADEGGDCGVSWLIRLSYEGKPLDSS